jgi:hypothetical protein
MHTQTHTHTKAHTHAHTDTNTHNSTHACTHTHTHALTHNAAARRVGGALVSGSEPADGGLELGHFTGFVVQHVLAHLWQRGYRCV